MSSATASVPIVLLPGFMLDETLWTEVAARLRQDSPVHCLRLEPGTTTRQIAEGVASSSPARFVLVGFSLGGYIARKVAELFPDRIAALILVATSLRTDSAGRAKAKQDAIAALDPATFRGLATNSISGSLHPARRSDRELITRIRTMGHRLGYDALVRQSNLQRDQIAASSLSCPTLVIAADEDSLRSIEETEELVAAIPGATLRMIAHSGHMIPLEQPEALAETIRQWLASLGEL